MTVVEVPKRNPQITGSDPVRDYSVGDTLNLTCISAPSNPPSQLEWRLNGRPVGGLHFRQSFLGCVTKESSFRNVGTFPKVGTFRRKFTS